MPLWWRCTRGRRWGRGMLVQGILDMFGPWASVGLLLLVIVLSVSDLVRLWRAR